MNWLGKVFVVVILIMSLVFMGLAMAVYATHKNWRDVVDGPPGKPELGLQGKLAQAKKDNDQLKTEHNRRVEELERLKTAAEQRGAQLDQERVSLTERNALVQAELDGLKQNQRDHIAALASTQAINKGLGDELGTLRTEIRKALEARDGLFKIALDATEELHDAAGKYNMARERSDQLTKQVAGMTTVMQAKGIDPATEPGSVVPTVEGEISKVEQKTGSQLAEITIGSDDGLKAGNTLEISRGDKYLGRLEIIQTSPDKSVGRIDRRFQQGQIQEGDRVRTRFK